MNQLIRFLIGGIILGVWACNSMVTPLGNDTNSVTADLEKAAAHYQNYCSGCHGEKLEAFVDQKWTHGNTKSDLIAGIKYGYPDDGMPAYDTTFTDEEIADLADYILEGIKNVDRYAFDNDIVSDTFRTATVSFELDTIVTGLTSPWGMAFLPDGRYLVTEKSGELYLVDQAGNKKKVAGAPSVLDKGQGGLLDVELHPNFEQNQWVYISYSKPSKEQGNLATTAVMRAKLEGDQLKEQEDIFIAQPYFRTRHHYGSRLEFDRAGYLYFSVGDRGNRDEHPQYLTNHCGKIHRINDDGSIPEDNPFVGQAEALASIYSYGHRNPQGVAMHPTTGKIWTHEHGPRGGDEVNIVEPGLNYGWPVISYGINYNGTTFTNITAKEGMEQPLHYWVPSIGPCGMTFIDSEKYEGWNGNLLIGSLKYKYLNLCRIEDDKIVEEELLMKNIGRVRNVEMGNDGYIYVAVEQPGLIYRLMPVEG